MRFSWLRWPRQASSPSRRWHVLVDGAPLATLQHPEFQDMFWTSLEIVAATQPPDARLADDAFWLGDEWQLVDAATGCVAALAVASAAGLPRGANRVVIRGLHAN